METSYGYPRDAEVGITPATKFRASEVALGEVHPADIADGAVDDDDLAVITIVHRGGEKREGHTHEGVDLDPHTSQPLPVGGRDVV